MLGGSCCACLAWAAPPALRRVSPFVLKLTHIQPKQKPQYRSPTSPPSTMATSITRRAANSLVKRAVGTQARNASTLKVGTY